MNLAVPGRSGLLLYIIMHGYMSILVKCTRTLIEKILVEEGNIARFLCVGHSHLYIPFTLLTVTLEV